MLEIWSIDMRIAAPLVICAVAACSASHAVPPSQIFIPGTKLYTESITSTANGAVIIGAMGPGAVFRAEPGATFAQIWIRPGTGGLASVLGVFADDKANTLWACSFTDAPNGTKAPPSNLHAFDLATGAPKGKWRLPTAGAVCNDIAVGSDGTAYVSDTRNMEILRLEPGAKSLEVWAGNGDFGPKGGVLDGIAVVRNRVVVNALETNRLFTVPIEADGEAGPVIDVKLDRPLENPDGQRRFGNDGILIVDGGEGGRLMHIALSGDKLDVGRVRTLRAGFADGPTSVTVVGETAYVIEAQFETAKRPPPKPFKATAVALVP
jgi:hypothetical protein